MEAVGGETFAVFQYYFLLQSQHTATLRGHLSSKPFSGVMRKEALDLPGSCLFIPGLSQFIASIDNLAP